MVWVRGATVDFVNSVGITINAALILLFAALAWRAALKRDFDTHRRWALRTFLVANAQWFLRVGVFGSFIVARGVFGLGKEIGEPLFHFWAFGCYLVPLAVLEIYLRAKESGSPRFKLATSAGLVTLTVFMGLGVFAISAVMWLPLVAKL